MDIQCNLMNNLQTCVCVISIITNQHNTQEIALKLAFAYFAPGSLIHIENYMVSTLIKFNLSMGKYSDAQ